MKRWFSEHPELMVPTLMVVPYLLLVAAAFAIMKPAPRWQPCDSGARTQCEIFVPHF